MVVASHAQVTSLIDDFRRKHLQELQLLSAQAGTSLGYGYKKSENKDAKSEASSSSSSGSSGSSPAIAGASA